MTAKENIKKYGVVTLKGLIGGCGPLGSLAVELFNVTISERRRERYEKLRILLASKEFNMDYEELKQKFYSPEFADIFEDAIHQAVRALSDERLEYLASILEGSLTEEEIKHLQTKRLLSILGEINDVEIIILQSYELEKQRDKNFKEIHKSIFKYEFVTRKSTQDEREQNAMFQNYKDHLVNLGLIGLKNSHSNSKLYLTTLGGMLLKKIKLEENPVALGNPLSPISGINTAEARYKEIKQGIDKDKRVEESFSRSRSNRQTELQKERELARKRQRLGF